MMCKSILSSSQLCINLFSRFLSSCFKEKYSEEPDNFQPLSASSAMVPPQPTPLSQLQYLSTKPNLLSRLNKNKVRQKANQQLNGCLFIWLAEIPQQTYPIACS